jgi:hypothetical protein
VARAPWEVTTVVACLPVLVLGMGSALAHLIRGDSVSDGATFQPDRQISRTGRPTAWGPKHQRQTHALNWIKCTTVHSPAALTTISSPSVLKTAFSE